MADHGTAPMSVRQFAELSGKVLRSLPQMSSSIAQTWIENEHALREALDCALASIIDAFDVTVNYGQSVEDAIEAGSYDWSDDNLTSYNFPPTRRGIEDVEVRLVHFGRMMTSGQVMEEFDKQSLRPATIEELLAFGAQDPDLQRQLPIVALGSVWQDSDGYRRIPVLFGSTSERCVDLLLLDYEWGDSFHFLGVRK